MTELMFGLIVAIGFLCLVLALLAYWHVSDKLWKAELRCVVLESWCGNLADNFVKLAKHLDELIEAHNRLATDFMKQSQQPPNDLNDADWWKENGGKPPWEPENN